MSRLPPLLLLAVALFTGFVPLRRCHASEGGGGVVPLGQHGHAHDAADNAWASTHATSASDRLASHALLHARGTPHTHADGHVHEEKGCLHDVCGCEHDDSAPATHDRCCVDTPFDAGLGSASSATLILPAIVPACALACVAADAAAVVPSFLPTRPDAPPDALRSVRTTVLLR